MLKGTIYPARDKSISHRSIMLGAIATGNTKIHNFLMGEDCISTINIFKNLGINIEINPTFITVYGKGLYGLKPSYKELNCNNSGTSMRLISGILAGQNFSSTLIGDSSLSKRPMKRIIAPLSDMNANIASINDNFTAPLLIKPSTLKPYNHILKIASAQVKSSLFLAGLYANGTTSVKEPFISRNHSEIMLKQFGANIKVDKTTTYISNSNKLYATEIFIPCDISSAAFFIVGAIITPNSDILLKDVSINPSRIGILEICKEMNANINIDNIRMINGENIADINVKYTKNLIPFHIKSDIIPKLIDEIPILALLATKADGISIIDDISELRKKECDRAVAIKNALTAIGGRVNIVDNKMQINPIKNYNYAYINTYFDHRIAMTFEIARLLNNQIKLSENKSINISYPNFYNDMKNLIV